MTELPPSRAPGAPFPSLAELSDKIASDQALTARQRQESCSALRSVGRALGRRLDEIPANPRQLRERLVTLTPGVAGVSPGRWNNIVSLTRVALKTRRSHHNPRAQYRADGAGVVRALSQHKSSPDPRGAVALRPLLQ
jgi:hypothetical protein